MKLSFKRDVVPPDLYQELDIEGYLSLFALDLPLLPRIILSPLSKPEGEAHFARLAALETDLAREKIQLAELINSCSKLRSLDFLLPFLEQGGLEQYHLFLLGEFILAERQVRRLESGLAVFPAAATIDEIHTALEQELTQGFAGLRFRAAEEGLRERVQALESALMRRLTAFEQQILAQTGLKMIYPYPKEIPVHSPLLAALQACPLVSVTPLQDQYAVDYRLAPEIKRLVTEKEQGAAELTRLLERRLKRLNAVLKPHFKLFQAYYHQRKQRTWDYALIYARQAYSLCFPTFREQVAGAEFHQAALPCLRRQQPERYVPLDLTLEPGANVLFGANMSGKTTVLKTLYFHLKLIASGLPVPAEAINLRFPEQVALRLRSSGHLKAGLSGFAEEIQFFTIPWTGSVYLLADELFQSTDPANGAVLTKIFLNEYAKMDLVFVCASHYPEALQASGVSLFRMKDSSEENIDLWAALAEDRNMNDLLATMPYQLERIAPEVLSASLERWKKPLLMALHFPLPEGIKQRIREYLTEPQQEGRD